MLIFYEALRKITKYTKREKQIKLEINKVDNKLVTETQQSQYSLSNYLKNICLS